MPTNMPNLTTGLIAAVAFALLPASAQGQSRDAKAANKRIEAPVAKPKDRAGGMKACPQYGAGFYRLNGSDTCIRIGGGVSSEIGTSSVWR